MRSEVCCRCFVVTLRSGAVGPSKFRFVPPSDQASVSSMPPWKIFPQASYR